MISERRNGLVMPMFQQHGSMTEGKAGRRKVRPSG